MNLYVLRHGIAAEPGTPGFKHDRERPLTPDGKRKMRGVAKAMSVMDLSFDLVFSSPFVRARQTAEIVVKLLHAQKTLALAEELAVGGNPRALIDRIRRLDPQPANVLLVGHEPFLSRLVSALVAGDSSASVTLKKGGLCKLAAESLEYGRCATLEWLLTPAQLRLMME